MKKIRQIDFNEALEATRNGVKVFAVNLETNKPVVALFKNLTIENALKSSYVYQIIEEGAK